MLLTSCQKILIIQLSRARLQQCFTFLLVVESVLDVNRLRGQNSHRCNPFFIRSMYFLLMMIIEKKSNKVIIHFTNSSSASLSPWCSPAWRSPSSTQLRTSTTGSTATTTTTTTRTSTSSNPSTPSSPATSTLQIRSQSEFITCYTNCVNKYLCCWKYLFEIIWYSFWFWRSMWWTWREEEEDAGWLSELSSNGKVVRYISVFYICIYIFVFLYLCT